MTYAITTPVKGQPISSSLFGQAVKDAINDLDTRVSRLEGTQQVVVKRGRRSTSTGTVTTTETGWLRLDNIPVQAGCVYQINTTDISIGSTVATDVGNVNVRVAYSATTGTLATIASPAIGILKNTVDNTTHPNIIGMNAFYFATANGFISLLFTLFRSIGTGNLSIVASVAFPVDVVVQFGGPDPGDTGVVL